MPPYNLIGIGGSAGSIEPMREVLARLPESLAAAVLIVVHSGDSHTSRLASVLSRGSRLAVADASSGDAIEPGRVYVAPPGTHLLVDGSRLVLSPGPKVNRHRPSIDRLLESIAAAAGPSGTGVILSGAPGEGAGGAAAIDRAGGTVLVQDPAIAPFPSMPLAALEAVRSAEALSVPAIAERLSEIVGRAALVSPGAGSSRKEDAGMDGSAADAFGCPDCGGVLSAERLGKASVFECRVGHRYSSAGLLGAMSSALEDAMWAAVRGLEEREILIRRLHSVGDRQGPPLSEAEEAATQGERLRSFLLNRIVVTSDGDGAQETLTAGALGGQSSSR